MAQREHALRRSNLPFSPKKKENDHKIKQTITYLTHLANNISFKLAYDYVSLHTICEIANKNN